MKLIIASLPAIYIMSYGKPSKATMLTITPPIARWPRISGRVSSSRRGLHEP